MAFALAVTGCGGGDGEESSTSAPTSSPPSTISSTSTTTGSSTISSGGGETTTTGQIGQGHRSVRQTVNAVLMSADPAQACNDELVTERYLEVAFGGREGCEQAVSPQSVSKSLGAYEEHINGDRATVTLHPSDGTYDGDKITVSLVRLDGNWKVDSLKSNAPVGP